MLPEKTANEESMLDAEDAPAIEHNHIDNSLRHIDTVHVITILNAFLLTNTCICIKQ